MIRLALSGVILSMVLGAIHTTDDRSVDHADLDLAVSLLREADGAAAEDRMGSSLLSGIASGFGRAGRPDLALAVIEKLHMPVDRRDALHALMAGQADSGNLPAARKTAPLIDRFGWDQLITRYAATVAYQGDAVAASRLVEAEISEAPQRIYAAKLLARAQADRSDFAGAARTVASITDPRERVWSCLYLGRQMISRGDFAGARRIADESRAAIMRGNSDAPEVGPHERTNKHLDPESIRGPILEELALAQAKRGDSPGAMASAEAIESTYWKVRAFARIAAMTARSGNPSAATASLSRASNLAADIDQNVFPLLEIASAQVAMGDVGTSRETFRRSIVRVDIAQQVEVVAQQVEAGDIEGAELSAGLIEDPDRRTQARTRIASGMALAGDMRAATRYAVALPSPEARARALLQIGRSLSRAGDRLGAGRALREAGGLTGPIEGETVRGLARNLAYVGDRSGAISLARKLSTPHTKARALLGAAEGMLPRRWSPIYGLNPP